MKRFVLCASVVLMVLSSCSKKTHPSVSNTPGNRGAIIETPVSANKEVTPPPVAVTPNAPVAVSGSPLVVIDGTGTVISSRDKLPAEIANKVDYNTIARSFTPAQKQNLVYRFKMLPPKVIFVPDRLVSKSARGYYCVYKKKFWYWKKEDGLFYLDETYYQ